MTFTLLNARPRTIPPGVSGVIGRINAEWRGRGERRLLPTALTVTCPCSLQTSWCWTLIISDYKPMFAPIGFAFIRTPPSPENSGRPARGVLDIPLETFYIPSGRGSGGSRPGGLCDFSFANSSCSYVFPCPTGLLPGHCIRPRGRDGLGSRMATDWRTQVPGNQGCVGRWFECVHTRRSR